MLSISGLMLLFFTWHLFSQSHNAEKAPIQKHITLTDCLLAIIFNVSGMDYWDDGIGVASTNSIFNRLYAFLIRHYVGQSACPRPFHFEFTGGCPSCDLASLLIIALDPNSMPVITCEQL